MRSSQWLIWWLILSCCNPSNKKDDHPPLINEGYPISEKDTSTLDFSANLSRNQEAGNLEQRLIAAGMVNIQSLIPDILVDLKYSSTDNFFG
ncbi:MAG: peptidase M15, partial [Cyclobacteriaceae bacterium]